MDDLFRRMSHRHVGLHLKVAPAGPFHELLESVCKVFLRVVQYGFQFDRNRRFRGLATTKISTVASRHSANEKATSTAFSDCGDPS